jgi:hypothetical protein
MSSQFSYELDERQIKILMQNSESDYSEAMWNRFESSLSSSSSTIKPSLAKLTPKFNLSISRSVIIPTLFVSLIGGLSILLFSFVDFKKKDVVITEKSLVTKPIVKPKSTITKPIAKTVVKPIVVVPTVTVAQTNINNEKQVAATVAKEPIIIETPKITAPNNNTMVAKKSNQSPVVVQPKHKKKRTNMVVEELQSISAPTTLNSSSEEPELKLK